MASASSVESIAELLQSLQDQEMVYKLYSDWSNLLKRDDINIDMVVRNKFDQWFLKCYMSREDEGRIIEQENFYIWKEESEKSLYNELKEQLKETIAGETEFPDKLKLQIELANLEQTSAEKWIKRAQLCVKEERKLIDIYNKTQTATVYMCSRRPCEIKYGEVQKNVQILQDALTEIENIVQDYEQTKKEYDDIVGIMEGLQVFTASVPQGNEANINGLQNKTQQQKSHAEKIQGDLNSILQNFSGKVQAAYGRFEMVHKDLSELTNELDKEVKAWQKQLKHYYVELASSVDLDRVAKWCAETGQLLRDITSRELSRLKNEMVSMQGSGNADFSILLNSCEGLHKQFTDLLHSFFQRTFVVSEQETWCVKKKDKTQIPKVTVRILAADSLGVLEGRKVNVCFILEDHLNECFDEEKTFNTNLLKRKGQKLKNDIVMFTKVKKGQKYEGKFTNIQLTFDRGTRQKLVHEEKYRLVFYTVVDAIMLWTISLPMVVTTGANQNCQCLASIMWQCYSTDVFAVPIETKTELPWSTVAEMLQEKIKKLSSRRVLTEENLNHLKHRILGQYGPADEDDPMISLTEFCVDKLDKESSGSGDEEKCTFSFWKWFLAVYNLIEKYLLQYWENGWIEGFISKAAAEKKLMESTRYRSAMYLLRFSDSHITDSQGLKSVFGLVTAAVLMVKKAKDNQKAKTVHHLDVAGHNKLKDKPLANIMLGTEDTKHQKFYQYLFPDLKPSEHLFNQYSSSDPVVPGYTGVRDAFIVDLEQALQKLEITGKRLSSSSSGSDSQDGFQDMKSPSLAGSKRIKRDSTDTKPSCKQMAGTPSSYSSGTSASNTPSALPQSTTKKTCMNCPTLRNLLTQSKSPPINSSPIQVTHSNSSDSVSASVTSIATTDQSFVVSTEASNLPTVVMDTTKTWDQNISQITENGVSTTFINSPAQEFSQLICQPQQWSQQPNIQEQNTSFTQMLNSTDFSNNQLSDFSQNPTLSGSLSQYGYGSRATDYPATSMYNVTENQQVPFYANIGTEHTDPSITQLPLEMDNHAGVINVVNSFLQEILPKLSREDKEKLLHTLQDASQVDTTVQTEEQPTSEYMVTSSSGTDGLTINQSQLEAGMESDSGSLVQNLDLFDSLDNITSY